MICQTLTITGDGVTDCASLSVDTWKPATLNPLSGADLPFTLRSANANKYFELRRGLAYKVVSGTTDAQGCFSGKIPAQPDDITYSIGICYPILGICVPFNLKMVRWSGGDGVPAGFALTVNGSAGRVKVDLNTDVTFHVKGASPAGKIDIKNITALPDITECSGIADSNGDYKCIFQFTKDEVIEFQGYGFANVTNIVTVTAGTPKEELDYKTIAVYGIAALAGAYILGSILKSGD